ncbi:MAG: hypothetical protein ABI603_03735 [Acidobacteriota bacterium]
MTSTGADDPVIAFYSGGPDHRGRTREDMLGWSDASAVTQPLTPDPNPADNACEPKPCPD